MFVELFSFSEALSCIVNVSDHTKRISLNNQPYMNKPALVDLNNDGYNQGLRNYLFTVKFWLP